MKLYYSPGACSLAGHIVINEGALTADFVKVDLKTKKTEKGEDYKAINPKGYVPALVLDDGDLMTENVALLPYLASLAPKLFPQDGMARWHALEKLGFVSTELHKSFAPIFNPSSTEEAKQAGKDHVAARLEIAAKELGERDFIVGDDFTIVDAYLFVILRWSQKTGVAVPAKLTAYYDRLSKRPAVKKSLEEEGLT